MDYPIVTQAEAKAAGLTRYFTGKPCKHGHISERRVDNRDCLECVNSRSATYKKRNPESIHAGNVAYRSANPDKTKAATAAYRAANHEKAKAAQAAWYAANREKAKTWQAEHRAQNREKVKAASALYRIKNLGKIKEKDAAWRKANPDKTAAHCRNRQARKRAAEGNHTSRDVQRIYEAQRGKCACCKEKVGKKYHVDHIQPLSKGGSNWPSNLQILCPTCNVKKHNRDPIEFMQARGLLL